ncbi:MAG: carboxymuconolactone decarboxylase family protein [Sulfurifustis sp.]
MPRIPYKPADSTEPRQLVEAIRARRGGRLLHLDRMLLHSPAYARGWNTFLGAVRNDLALPAKLRELAICCVAVLNRAEYEFHHHAPQLIATGGTREQVEALRRLDASPADAKLFDATERAVIDYTLEMTRAVAVSDAAFARVAAALASTEHMVELTGVIAAYNMVSRFLVALQITPEDESG